MVLIVRSVMSRRLFSLGRNGTHYPFVSRLPRERPSKAVKLRAKELLREQIEVRRRKESSLHHRSCRFFGKCKLKCCFMVFGYCSKDAERCVQVDCYGEKFVFGYKEFNPFDVVLRR